MKIKRYFVNQNLNISEAIKKINKLFYKCLIIINDQHKVLGTLSDGDIRRALLKKKKFNTKIEKIINKKFIFFYSDNINLSKAKKILLNNSNRVDLIPILDRSKKISDLITKDNFIKDKKKNRKNLNTEVIIMAGGRGTRLKPLSNIIPKPLIPINNQTLIENIIDKYLKYGFVNFSISINYKSFLLKSFFKELQPQYNLNFIEEKKPLGTAGALGLIKKKKSIKNYFVCNCDTVVNADLNKVLKNHIKSKKNLTIVACNKKHQIPYGVIKLSEDKSLLDIVEKPIIKNLINTGMYILSSGLLKQFEKNKFYSMDTIIKKLIEIGDINIYKISDKAWVDVGQWPEYKNFLKKIS